LEFHAEADETIMAKSTNGTNHKEEDRHDMADDSDDDDDDDDNDDDNDNEEVRFGIIIVEKRNLYGCCFSVKEVDTTIKVWVFCSMFFLDFMKLVDGNYCLTIWIQKIKIIQCGKGVV
jgi:hypothetical protein